MIQTANAGADLASTAIVREIQVTVAPRTFQSFPSPDGQWLAQVILYDCAQIPNTDQDYTYAYETLKISAWTVETQLLGCGGLGAGGLGGLFWTADSRFFYYTTASEGWPDGGYPWIRPMSRFDTTTGKSEALRLPVYSPDRQKIAGGQGTDLVIWDIHSAALTRFPGPLPGQGWINWLSWSPDGRGIVYLTQAICQGACGTILTRVDLATDTQTRLLGEQDPSMLTVDWSTPDRLTLTASDFSTSYTYDLKSSLLSLLPKTTPTAGTAKTPAPVPFTETPVPTYPPDPAFPADLYPPANPFRLPVDRGSKEVLGHGCPSLSGVKAEESPSVETIQPVLEAVRTGDVKKIRTNSDVAYWPVTGLELRRQVHSLSSGYIAVQSAAQSPLADLLKQACGAEVLRASWWAQVNSVNGISDYFLVHRKDHWLVWLSVYDYGQFKG